MQDETRAGTIASRNPKLPRCGKTQARPDTDARATDRQQMLKRDRAMGAKQPMVEIS